MVKRSKHVLVNHSKKERMCVEDLTFEKAPCKVPDERVKAKRVWSS